MIWFTSDLHFNHHNAIGYSNRPFANVEEMNEALISRWNSKVQDDDLVYVLGDLTLGKYSDMIPIVSRLRGRKILLQGNHDKLSRAQYLKLGFLDVFQEVVIKLGNTRIRLSHFPYKPTFWQSLWLPAKAKKYSHRRPINRGGWLLHGHTHSKRKIRGRMIHVGVDAHNYYPVSLGEIESIISRNP